MMRGFTVNSDGYGGNLSCPREVSAVTAACMAMRKLTFEAIGGFNEDFRNVYQDLDLSCAYAAAAYVSSGHLALC